MTRLDHTADRVELRALVDRYAIAADSRDRAAFAGVFTADGVLAVGPGAGLVGPDAIPAPLDYLDRYVRTDDGWRIAQRRVNVDWQEDRPASPPAGPLGPIGPIG